MAVRVEIPSCFKMDRGVPAYRGGLIIAAKPTRKEDGIVLTVLGVALFLAGFVWPRSKPAPRWLQRLGLAAFVAVVLQGVLGGLRVVLFKDELGIFHAALAQLFFVLVCLLALFTSPWWWTATSRRESAASIGEDPGVRFWFLAGTSLIFAQLILGATMRHQHAGSRSLISPWPTVSRGPRWIPNRLHRTIATGSN
jgi:heme A synthase